MIKQAYLFFLFSLFAVCAEGQSRWQADLRIQSLTITCSDPGRVTAKITVRNSDDDEAKNAAIIIMLPLEVKVVSVPKNCSVLNSGLPAGVQWAGCLQCRLGPLPANKETTVAITTSRSSRSNHFSVFTYSESPDPDTGNNYKEGTAVCQ